MWSVIYASFRKASLFGEMMKKVLVVQGERGIGGDEGGDGKKEKTR